MDPCLWRLGRGLYPETMIRIVTGRQHLQLLYKYIVGTCILPHLFVTRWGGRLIRTVASEIKYYIF